MTKMPTALFILLLAIICSCKGAREAKAFNPVVTDTSTEKSFDIALEDFTGKLLLPSIRKGVDSFEYRFWLMAEEPDLMNLIRIRFENSSWMITETLIWSHIPKYNINKNDTVNHLLETIVDSTKSWSIRSSIDITQLIDSLQHFNLENAAPNINIVNSFVPHMDGWQHTIEIADRHNYRLIFYPCPVTITGLHNFHESMKRLFTFLLRTLPIKFAVC